MENALKAKPRDIREQYEQKVSALTSAYSEAMLENKALKKLRAQLTWKRTANAAHFTAPNTTIMIQSACKQSRIASGTNRFN